MAHTLRLAALTLALLIALHIQVLVFPDAIIVNTSFTSAILDVHGIGFEFLPVVGA